MFLNGGGLAGSSAGKVRSIIMDAARRSLDDAEFALSGGRHGLACSAAYYAAFHAARARISSAGRTAFSHRGLSVIIGELYGTEYPEVQATLSRLQKHREEQDYRRAEELDDRSARASVEAARSFVMRLSTDIDPFD